MTTTETKWSFDHANERITTVQGNEYLVWANYAKRCTEAKNVKTGEIKSISSSGYVTNDLTVRKAIAGHFNLGSFKK